MAKIGKPRGLIDYLALADAPAEMAGAAPKPIWKHILRTRTLIYTAIWAAFGSALLYALFIRSDIGLTVSPVRNPTYVVQSDGAIRNIYDVRLRNMLGDDRVFRIGATSDASLSVTLEGGTALEEVNVSADSTLLQRVYVTAQPGSPAALADATNLRLWVEDTATGSRASKDTTFNGTGEQ
jgi:polyferredoxin